MKGEIKNDGDWWIAWLCERCEPPGTDPKDRRRRNTTWVNAVLIHAKDASSAYDKAVRIGKQGRYRFTNVRKEKMKWRFVGVWDLLPLYDNIADGEEIYWNDYGMMSAGKAQDRVMSKGQVLASLRKPKDHE